MKSTEAPLRALFAGLSTMAVLSELARIALPSERPQPIIDADSRNTPSHFAQRMHGCSSRPVSKKPTPAANGP